MPDPILTYDVVPPAGAPVAVLCGLPAALFGAAILVATVVENRGYVHWHGPPVVALWACLLATPVLGIIAVVSGVRALRRRGGDRRLPWVGAVAGTVAVLELALWFAMVARVIRF